MAGFSVNFSGIPGNKAQKVLENFGENSEQHLGRMFENSGELSSCNFADLPREGAEDFGTTMSLFS